jgi:hypothetical protein
MNDIAVKVRDAVPEDAPAACHIMRRSIAELCGADHNNDPVILQRWLSNNTPCHHIGPRRDERVLSIDRVTITADRSSR